MVHMGKDITSKGLWPPPRMRCLRWTRYQETSGLEKLRSDTLFLSFPRFPGGPTSRLGFKLCGRMSHGGVESPLHD